MRGQGIESSRGTGIEWRKGAAEATGMPDQSADLVSMASSFHWANFDQACDEFYRILRPGGLFVALWNPRLIETNPLLVEIEEQITRLKPDVKRVSSGRSGITERLTEMLSAKPQFTDVLYLEGRHSVQQTPEQYLGAWRSVNDLRVWRASPANPRGPCRWSSRKPPSASVTRQRSSPTSCPTRIESWRSAAAVTRAGRISRVSPAATLVKLLMENRSGCRLGGPARLGLVVALLNVQLRGAALAHALAQAQPRHLIVGASLWCELAPALAPPAGRMRLWCRCGALAIGQRLGARRGGGPGPRARWP